MKLPDSTQLDDLLELRSNAPHSESLDLLFDEALLQPLQDFLNRPGKNIRGRMVEVGYQLISGLGRQKFSPLAKARCEQCSYALEALHAGSLVVDDIQDGSKERRGSESLHLKYGVPIALNAGNWLYFWPFELISALELEVSQEIQIYKMFNKTLLRAHFGQALDLGSQMADLEQSKVFSVCMASLELKTGALMALALKTGAVLAGASREQLKLLHGFGHGFGVGLQMFDDLGRNKFEDLRLQRPSWIWAAAAKNCTPPEYQEFLKATRSLPDLTEINRFFSQSELLFKARAQASEHLNESLSQLSLDLANSQSENGGNERDALAESFVLLRDLQQTLERAYGAT